MFHAIRLNFNSFYVRPEALADARVEIQQKLSSFCTSLNIHQQRGVTAQATAIYIFIFMKFLNDKCRREELDSPECEVANFCVSWKL